MADGDVGHRRRTSTADIDGDVVMVTAHTNGDGAGWHIDGDVVMVVVDIDAI